MSLPEEELIKGQAVALTGGAGIVCGVGDNALPFTSPISHLLVQNQTATALGIEFDAPSSAGSLLLAANSAPFMIDVNLAVLHLFGNGTTPTVNGAVAAGVVVKGWT